MSRTTSELVQGIIDVGVGVDLTPFISAANRLVTKCCSEDDYDATELQEIETWLSAHFYALKDQQVSSEGAGGINQSFQYSIGLMLAQTKYGQTAMLLDTEGGLAALSKQMEQGRKRIVSIDWLGIDPDEEVSE